MLLVGLQALEPVYKEDIGNTDVHNSHLFTVEKFTADGTHDKFKSRMVMNRMSKTQICTQTARHLR